MHCNICQTLIPPGASECPNCGIPTSYMSMPNSDSDGSPGIEQVPLANETAPLPATPEPAQEEASLAGYEPPTTSQPVEMIAPGQPASQSHRSSRIINTFAILLSILLILAGAGFAYHVLVAQPATMHADATATAQAQATQRAEAANPRALYQQATGGAPTVRDPLNNKAASSWGEFSGNNGGCAFTNGAYHITSLQAGLTACLYKPNTFRNFAFQVQMTIVRGDAGGLIFRLPASNSQSFNAYLFTVNVIGTYTLVSTPNDLNVPAATIASPAIEKGINHANMLTVIAYGNSIYLYVNKQYLASTLDNRYSEGSIGLLALNLHDPSEVAFNNAQVWTL